MEPNQEKPNILMRIAVIVGIIIILMIVAFGIIKLVPKALSSLANVSISFSSLFSGKQEIKVTLNPATVASGEKTILSFTDSTKKTGGFYALSYPCQNSASLSYQSGTKLVTIPCGSSYPFSSANNTLALIANAQNGVTDLPVSISYMASASSSTATSAGSAKLTINKSSGVTTTVPDNTNTNTGNTNTGSNGNTNTGNTGTTNTGNTGNTTTSNSNPNGHADLVVRLVAIGIADPATGAFVPTQSFNANNTVVIKFEVTNIGDKNSDMWSFQTNQPMINTADNTKSAVGLQSLAPGASTGAVTLALSGIQTYGGTVTIVATPSVSASEIQTANNTLQINIPAGTNNGGGTYNNGQADLSVSIVDTGIVTNGYYTKTNTVRTSDQVRIHFTVRNLGGQATGQYNLTANLPVSTGSNSINNGSYQQSLAPGQIADYFIDFTGIQNQGYQNISITANPATSILETNTSNNTASSYLNVTY